MLPVVVLVVDRAVVVGQGDDVAPLVVVRGVGLGALLDSDQPAGRGVVVVVQGAVGAALPDQVAGGVPAT